MEGKSSSDGESMLTAPQAKVFHAVYHEGSQQPPARNSGCSQRHLERGSQEEGLLLGRKWHLPGRMFLAVSKRRWCSRWLRGGGQEGAKHPIVPRTVPTTRDALALALRSDRWRNPVLRPSSQPAVRIRHPEDIRIAQHNSRVLPQDALCSSAALRLPRCDPTCVTVENVYGLTLSTSERMLARG